MTAERIVDAAEAAGASARILLSGGCIVTEEAAEVFVRRGVRLIGVDSQSVGPAHAPMAVHKILLSAEVVLLEGLVLAHVSDGVYTLCAVPLKLGGCEGAPCRAILMTDEA
jgi:arylformamidase